MLNFAMVRAIDLAKSFGIAASDPDGIRTMAMRAGIFDASRGCGLHREFAFTIPLPNYCLHGEEVSKLGNNPL